MIVIYVIFLILVVCHNNYDLVMAFAAALVAPQAPAQGAGGAPHLIRGNDGLESMHLLVIDI